MMRTMGGVIAALLVLAAGAVAQPPKSKAMPPGFWDDLFGRSKPKDLPLPGDKDDRGGKGAKDDTPAAQPPSREERAREYDRLEKALQRRLEVCNRLREIALETSNPALEEEAARLDQLAFEIFQRESSRLLGVKLRSPERDEAELTGAKLPSPREPHVSQLPSRFRGEGRGVSDPPGRAGEGQR